VIFKVLSLLPPFSSLKKQLVEIQMWILSLYKIALSCSKNNGLDGGLTVTKRKNRG